MTTLSIPPSSQSTLQPGYISTISLRGSQYKVFAYILNADGSRQYLPDHCDPQTIEKVRTLTAGLLNAHDSKRQASASSSLEIKGMDARGLIQLDDTLVSHDFALQPHSPVIADQMVAHLASCGRQLQASAIKAQDLWDTLDEVVRTGIAHPPLTPPPLLPQNTPPADVPQAEPIPPVSPPSFPAQPTSIDQDIRTMDLESPDWYQNIPLRTKYRIVKQVADGSSPLGGIYAQVWDHFTPAPEETGDVLERLEKEKGRLAQLVRSLPSGILERTRQKAESIYDAFLRLETKERIKEKAKSLMNSDFARREQLNQRIREQAEAEGVIIEDWNQEWAQHHYADDARRFVQALARWLDNDTNA